jgi:hypothetical protein
MAIKTHDDGREVATTSHSWFKRREECCERASEACEACGRYLPLWAGQAHHVIGRGLGGGKRDDRLTNLKWLCEMCHCGAHGRFWRS